MGWLFSQSHSSISDVRKHLDSNYNLELVKSRVVGSTYYAAIKDKKGRVFCSVVLMKMSDGWGGYKDMDEFCGPTAAQCPNSILRLLSPTSEFTDLGEKPREWADDFRRRSMAYNDKPVPKEGDIIVFENPMKFTNGITISEFTVVKEWGRRGKRKMTYFRSEGRIYTITGWKKMNYSIKRG